MSKAGRYAALKEAGKVIVNVQMSAEQREALGLAAKAADLSAQRYIMQCLFGTDVKREVREVATVSAVHPVAVPPVPEPITKGLEKLGAISRQCHDMMAAKRRMEDCHNMIRQALDAWTPAHRDAITALLTFHANEFIQATQHFTDVAPALAEVSAAMRGKAKADALPVKMNPKAAIPGLAEAKAAAAATLAAEVKAKAEAAAVEKATLIAKAGPSITKVLTAAFYEIEHSTYTKPCWVSLRVACDRQDARLERFYIGEGTNAHWHFTITNEDGTLEDNDIPEFQRIIALPWHDNDRIPAPPEVVRDGWIGFYVATMFGDAAIALLGAQYGIRAELGHYRQNHQVNRYTVQVPAPDLPTIMPWVTNNVILETSATFTTDAAAADAMRKLRDAAGICSVKIHNPDGWHVCCLTQHLHQANAVLAKR